MSDSEATYPSCVDSLTAEGAQLDMFPSSSAGTGIEREELRGELAGILAKVRAEPDEPLDASDAVHFRNIFFRMADGLPAEEAEQLRLAFETELTRRRVA